MQRAPFNEPEEPQMCKGRSGLGRPYPDLQFPRKFTDTGFLQKNCINLHTKSPKKVGVRYVSCTLILIVWRAHFTDTG